MDKDRYRLQRGCRVSRVGGRLSNRCWMIGRVGLAAADARKLAVRVIRRNFREGNAYFSTEADCMTGSKCARGDRKSRVLNWVQ